MKNKTRKIIRITLAILLVVLIQAMGITYAKYVTSEKAIGQAEVAQWAFQIKKSGEEVKTIKLVNTATTSSLAEGKIAPGTTGKFTLVLDGTGSEVDMDYALEFSGEQNKPDNLTFSYLGNEYKSLAEIGQITGKILYGDTSRTRTIQISWLWPYETGSTEVVKSQNDKIDTENANSITEYTFDAVVTATQTN